MASETINLETMILTMRSRVGLRSDYIGNAHRSLRDFVIENSDIQENRLFIRLR